MSNNLPQVLVLVFGSEGGYVVDSGGPTKFGITATTLGAWRQLGRAATIPEVKALTVDEAAKILDTQYARPLLYDQLPAGLDYCLFDYSVNSGPSQAVKTLQRVLKVDVDGHMGVNTLEGIKTADTGILITQLCDARLTFLKGLKTWRTYGNGWSNRVEHVRFGALGMVAKPDVAADPAVIVEAPPGPEAANPSDTKFTANPAGKAAVTTAIGIGTSTVGAAKDAIQTLTGTVPYLNYVLIGLGVLGTVITVAGIAWAAYNNISKISENEQ